MEIEGFSTDSSREYISKFFDNDNKGDNLKTYLEPEWRNKRTCIDSTLLLDGLLSLEQESSVWYRYTDENYSTE